MNIGLNYLKLILLVEEAPYWNVNVVLLTFSNAASVGRSSSILECKFLGVQTVSFVFAVEVAPYWNVNNGGSFISFS